MTKLTLKKWDFSIGDARRLACIAGLNVLEDAGLALETAAHLKGIARDLDMPYAFKASFDKANRSSIHSYRGPGITEGLRILADVKARHNVPICTDLHEIDQARSVAAIADIVQVPAFLCRQTDFVLAAARAAAAAGGLLHVKKGQFLAPDDA